MNPIDIGEDGLVGTRRRGNWGLPCMGVGVGGQVDEELGRKRRNGSRGVVVSVEIFRVTCPARIDYFQPY